MTPIAPMFLALVCSMFATTSELPNHGSNLIDNRLHGDIQRIHPRLRYFHYKEKRVLKTNRMRQQNRIARGKREMADPCKPFMFKPGTSESTTLTNPRDYPEDQTYSSNTTCITTIEASEGHVVVLTFVDTFKIEGNPPNCENDYLEIRDGRFGYALPVYKFCGTDAPTGIVSSGPHMWLKFSSDDTIEYEGFDLRVDFQPNAASRKRPECCYINLTGRYGEIDSHNKDVQECKDQSPNSLDIQWKIETPPDTSIFLNFTDYALAMPNECESNLVQVFGAEPDFDHKLEVYCGSATKPVTTKLPKEGLGPSNIMYIRMYANSLARDSKFKAQFTAFRTLEGEDVCSKDDEFDCEDGTCIDAKLKCNDIANCRLKADEDCETEKKSLVNEPQILTMLGIFSLVLFAIGVFFLVTCIRKVYRDHQYIKEHLQAKSQDRLDRMSDSELSFGSGPDSEPRESLEQENLTNEMYTQQMDARKSSSIGSDFLQPGTPPDLDDDWPDRTPILADYKGRPRRSDASRKESLTTKALKEERQEEYEGRPRNSNARKRKVSLRTENSRDETWNDTEIKGRHKRRDSKKEESTKTKKLKEYSKEIENTARRDKVQGELSRTNTFKEDIEYKGRTRRDSNKKRRLPKTNRSKEEEWKETDYKEKRKRDNNKKEQPAATEYREEEHKEVEEHKEYHKHDTNKRENFPAAKNSREEWKDTEYRDKQKRNTNKTEQLPTANDLKEGCKDAKYKEKHNDANNKEPFPSAKELEESKEVKHKGRPRHSDTSKKEESLKTKTSKEDITDKENMSRPYDNSKKEQSLRTKTLEEMKSRDASVATLDTKESGCQTRESLLLTDPVSSDGTNSSSNSRGRSAFGRSNTSIAQPCPAETTRITIDLQATPREPVNIDAGRRPMSAETTRSAPDVIIVAKPIRFS